MKCILPFLILLFTLSGSAQSKKHAGKYESSAIGEGYSHINKLTLNPNGTFLFHNYRYIENGIPKEENKYGKGTWTSKNKLIFFNTDENDINYSHVLDFNNSKARFISKSPRDKSARIVKNSIRFYESEIFWITGRTLLKQ